MAADQPRTDLCDIAFGDDLAGQSVLSIGCHLGHSCLTARERGASRVVGLDIDPQRVSQAALLARSKGYQVEYYVSDVESAALDVRFDVVLCANILNDLFDPLSVLHKLAGSTARSLALEMPVPRSRDDARSLRIRSAARRQFGRAPAIYVASGTPISKRIGAAQKYFLTADAVAQILKNHRGLFSAVEVLEPRRGGHTIVKATRRRIRHLVVVAGPTSSGKSTFLKNLAAADIPSDLASKLPAGAEKWPQVGADHLLRRDRDLVETSDMDGLVLHYDIMRPISTGILTYRRDQSLDLIACADAVTFITLRPTQAHLIEQFRNGEIDSVSRSREPRWRSLTKKLLRLALPPSYLFKADKAAGRLAYSRRLLTCYERSGWLDNWYWHWAHHIRDIAPGAVCIQYDPRGRALLD